MPFILTFGSFGDFVTAIQILRQVQQALRDAEGSWTKYQGLVNRISAFQVLLVQAGGLRLKDIDSGLKNALDFHVSQAEEAAKTFLLHIGGYHASLSPGGTGRWFLDTWKRVRWNIRGGDVKEFLEAMRDQTIAIGLLLSTVNVMLAEAARADDGHLQTALKCQIDQTLEFHRAYFGDIMDSFLQKLWAERLVRNPGDYTVNEFPILFTNAMGVRQTLPFYLCVVRESLVRYIKNEFHGTPGQTLIDNEKFALNDESGNAIQKGDWEKRIRPGLKVTMDVVIRRSLLGVEDHCPKCTRQISPQSHACALCDASISELDTEQWEAHSLPGAGRPAGGKRAVGPEVTPQSQPRGDDIHEATFIEAEIVRFFKRITIINDSQHRATYVHFKQPSSGDHAEVAKLARHAMAFLEQYENSGVLAGLEEGINALNEANDSLPDNHPNKPGYLNNLGASLLRRFERLSSLADLEEAIMVQKQAIRLTPHDHPNRPSYLSNLGISFRSRFERLGDIADLDGVIATLQQAVTLTHEGHRNKPGYLSNLGDSILARFRRLGDIGDLYKAIKTQQQAIRLIRDGRPHKPRCLSDLGNSFQSLFDRLGDNVDLDNAITAQQRAVRLTHDSHPDKPMYLSHLGICYRSRFEHLGHSADLDKAITAQQKAVMLTPDGHSDKPLYLSDLGISVRSRFERLGDVVDLDEAIATMQQGVKLARDANPDKPRRFYDLGVSFLRRFERLGDIVDLDEAIAAQHEAVKLTPHGHPHRTGYLDRLGRLIRSRSSYPVVP